MVTGGCVFGFGGRRVFWVDRESLEAEARRRGLGRALILLFMLERNESREAEARSLDVRVSPSPWLGVAETPPRLVLTGLGGWRPVVRAPGRGRPEGLGIAEAGLGSLERRLALPGVSSMLLPVRHWCPERLQ